MSALRPTSRELPRTRGGARPSRRFEIYKAVSSLTDDPGLPSGIGRWRDTMDDAEVLQMSKRRNEMGEPFVLDVSVRG
jgi:hypothetical protein